MEFSFTLKYQLSGDDCNLDELVERLGAAGCDDALVGIGQPGRIALEFTREADNARAALISALTDVKHAVPTSRLIEAAPDFVGLTDVAELIGMSRQNLRKLMVSYSTSFPVPVHEGSAAIWHLADVLGWLQAKGGYGLEQTIIEVSKATKQINVAKEARLLTPEIQREMYALVA
ncbi:MAG: DNA-binding protein [Herbaspirillum sp.]|jgi:predicted DNA-binding transcriptional regulator AlpA|nr:DNA-binding protein [Herbaspirillum sp.]